MPTTSENDRTAIIRNLRDCIEIATASEAGPLRVKAEALLRKALSEEENGQRLH